MGQLTDQENEMCNRIVNGNMMAANLRSLQGNIEYFRGNYGGNEKNVFKRIVRNLEILFDEKKMSKDELSEVTTLSDALVDREYDVRSQYRKHIENQIIENRTVNDGK